MSILNNAESTPDDELVERKVLSLYKVKLFQFVKSPRNTLLRYFKNVSPSAITIAPTTCYQIGLFGHQSSSRITRKNKIIVALASPSV